MHWLIIILESAGAIRLVDKLTLRRSTHDPGVWNPLFIFSAAIGIENIYELTRKKMTETEVDGIPKIKNQVLIPIEFFSN